MARVLKLPRLEEDAVPHGLDFALEDWRRGCAVIRKRFKGDLDRARSVAWVASQNLGDVEILIEALALVRAEGWRVASATFYAAAHHQRKAEEAATPRRSRGNHQ